jgi:AraC-like DNA-binding protein
MNIQETKQKIKEIITIKAKKDEMIETGIKGVHLFSITEPIRCVPAIYNPAIIAIVNGSKEAILNGNTYVYDSSQYMCCTMTMPIEVGAPTSSIDNPLLGVYISLDTELITELTLKIETTTIGIKKHKNSPHPEGLSLSHWDNSFSEALLRLLQITNNPLDTTILGRSRLRELYYTILKGDSGDSIKRSFGIKNDISKTIKYLSSNLDKSITIDDMAKKASMSRAVFHRKFKEATTISPIQFLKSMRLNTAAMKIAGGLNINEAAMQVGYISSSQFSREFKRTYGQSPKQWSQSKELPTEITKGAFQFFDQF